MTCFARAQTPGGAGAGRGGRPSDVGAGGAKHPETPGPGSPVSGALPFLEAPLRLKHPPTPRLLPPPSRGSEPPSAAPERPVPLQLCELRCRRFQALETWAPPERTDRRRICHVRRVVFPEGRRSGDEAGDEGGLTADGQARRWAPAGRGGAFRARRRFGGQSLKTQSPRGAAGDLCGRAGVPRRATVGAQPQGLRGASALSQTRSHIETWLSRGGQLSFSGTDTERLGQDPSLLLSLQPGPQHGPGRGSGRTRSAVLDPSRVPHDPHPKAWPVPSRGLGRRGPARGRPAGVARWPLGAPPRAGPRGACRGPRTRRVGCSNPCLSAISTRPV